MSDCPACKRPLFPEQEALVVTRLQALDADSRLIVAVQTMRNHQRDWFAGDKSPGKLEAARKAEREVDRLLREMASGQKALF